MVVISIGPYKAQAPRRIDSIGQRAKFKVKPQKVGYIIQSIRAFAFLDESIDQSNYTEAWRIQPNIKIEQQGDDDFLIPRQWFYIIAHAWYQEFLKRRLCTWCKQRSLGSVDGNAIYQSTTRGDASARTILDGELAKKDESPRSKLFSKNVKCFKSNFSRPC